MVMAGKRKLIVEDAPVMAEDPERKPIHLACDVSGMIVYRKIAEKYGGRIRTDSVEVESAAFYFTPPEGMEL